MIDKVGNLTGRPPARAAMFDFDGTLALVRSGWMPAMMEMIMSWVGPLAADPEAERVKAEDYVTRLTGKDTIHQMSAFEDHVRSLGGAPHTAAQFKADFFASLAPIHAERLRAVREGRKPVASLLVPGTVEFLEALRARGVRLYLASGTKHDDIVAESELFGLAGYFDDIHGSAPDRLSKQELLESIVASGVPADEVITFGDGRVEIEAAKATGGIAVGVATDEEADCMAVDPQKRRWLIEAGADYIVANYLDPDVLRIVTGEL